MRKCCELGTANQDHYVFHEVERLDAMKMAKVLVPLFIGLSEEQRMRLLAICVLNSFEPVEMIYYQGRSDGAMRLELAGGVDLVAVDQRNMATVSRGQCSSESTLSYSPKTAPLHSVHAAVVNGLTIAPSLLGGRARRSFRVGS
ncbi:MAG: hypothetical protein ACI9HK_002071 [Pirellulaceae bacterium]|jgi:hypothetical protein